MTEIMEAVDVVWVKLSPDERIVWSNAVEELDPEVAGRAIVALRDASHHRPSLNLFLATYRGLLSAQNRRTTPSSEWFQEQREKLRSSEDSDSAQESEQEQPQPQPQSGPQAGSEQAALPGLSETVGRRRW